MQDRDVDDQPTETQEDEGTKRPRWRLAEIAPRPPTTALVATMPECEGCGEQTPDGMGGEFGDETYEWLCEECHGGLASDEYRVKAGADERGEE